MAKRHLNFRRDMFWIGPWHAQTLLHKLQSKIIFHDEWDATYHSCGAESFKGVPCLSKGGDLKSMRWRRLLHNPLVINLAGDILYLYIPYMLRWYVPELVKGESKPESAIQLMVEQCQNKSTWCSLIFYRFLLVRSAEQSHITIFW